MLYAANEHSVKKNFAKILNLVPFAFHRRQKHYLSSTEFPFHRRVFLVSSGFSGSQTNRLIKSIFTVNFYSFLINKVKFLRSKFRILKSTFVSPLLLLDNS